MNLFETYLIGLAVAWAIVTLVWLLSLALRDASIMDPFWGPGFMVLMFVYASLGDGYGVRKGILSVLVTLWAFRLALHLLVRNREVGEDYRYRKWREVAGPSFWWKSYFRVFLLQGLIMWLISAPLLAAAVYTEPQRFTALDYTAVVLWVFGFFFEAVGDWQLMRFKKQPENKGKLLTTGLWRYTRHPNYFGDAMLWWGYFAFAAATGAYWTVYSPILMTFFLLNVSGVALLEKNLKKSKPGFEDYMNRTNAFFPWFPRKS